MPGRQEQFFRIALTLWACSDCGGRQQPLLDMPLYFLVTTVKRSQPKCCRLAPGDNDGSNSLTKSRLLWHPAARTAERPTELTRLSVI